MNKISKVLQISSVYVCLVLGAGFASGKEIMRFFTEFGALGFLGLIISSVLFFAVGYAVLDMVYVHKLKSYEEFMKTILGNRLGMAMEYISILFLFVLFSAMLSCCGSIANEAFGASKNIGIFLMAFVCFVTLLFDAEGIITMSSILAPFLLFGSMFIGMYMFFTNTSETFLSFDKELYGYGFLFTAVIYVSMNTITSVPVLVSLHKLVYARKVAFLSAAIAGVAVFLIAMSLQLPLYRNFEELCHLDLPLLHLSLEYSVVIKAVYTLILILSIYTTAISSGFAFIKAVQTKGVMKPGLLKLLTLIAATMCASFGFSNFVNDIYPLFGYLGLFQLLVILYHTYVRKQKTT